MLNEGDGIFDGDDLAHCYTAMGTQPTLLNSTPYGFSNPRVRSHSMRRVGTHLTDK